MRATKASLAVIGLSAVLAGGVIGGATAANAANGNGHAYGHCKGGYPPKDCKVKHDKDHGHRGEKFEFEADGYKPGENADGDVHSAPIHVGTYVANAAGVVTGSFTVPSTLSNGTHTFVLTGRSSGVVKTFSFTVTGAPAGGGNGNDNGGNAGGANSGSTGSGSTGSGLAMTGTNVAAVVGGGAALMLAGGALMVASRRRKHVNPAI
ncbi:hypothetical protein [Terrabacter sp. BE26]|uniref:hypothetical protein n=1 Tax=Terrabacter sp. BE26 TaxID=2898152 RepID=UPI0035BE708E